LLTASTERRACRGSGSLLADLLIGATALELGYSVATNNSRHFELIPGLTVKKL
jgi:predicted nucleic acid-binding protein